MELPVVNHEDYFAKIGDDHKFPINKFGELANYLTQNKIVNKFHKPSACSFETLSYAHSKNYILDIKNKTLSKEEVKKIGFPLVDSVVQRSLVATGGTVLASKLAINSSTNCSNSLIDFFKTFISFSISIANYSFIFLNCHFIEINN